MLDTTHVAPVARCQLASRRPDNSMPTDRAYAAPSGEYEANEPVHFAVTGADHRNSEGRKEREDEKPKIKS